MIPKIRVQLFHQISNLRSKDRLVDYQIALPMMLQCATNSVARYVKHNNKAKGESTTRQEETWRSGFVVIESGKLKCRS